MKTYNANDFTDTTKAYITELANSKYEPIPLEIENDLFKKIKEGNKRAHRQLIEAHLRLVINIAKSYRGKGVPMAELISEGNMGLITAIERFDENKNVRLCAYAPFWINKYILELMGGQINKQETNFTEITHENGKPIDVPQQESETKNEQYIQKAVDTLLSELDDRGRLIIEHYYGLNDKKQLTTFEIAKKLSLSTERVRQLRAKILSNLRSQALVHNISSSYDE